MSKYEQMWHLLYVCSIFAIRENPFFRPVVLGAGCTIMSLLQALIGSLDCLVFVLIGQSNYFGLVLRHSSKNPKVRLLFCLNLFIQ